MKKFFFLLLPLLLGACTEGRQREYDIIVYGSTPSGIIAAVTAAREGASVAIVEDGTHLGGMVTGGLSYTDTGKTRYIGGITREFFERLGDYYGKPLAWEFESSVAKKIFQEMLEEEAIPVFFAHPIKSVQKNKNKIISFLSTRGTRFRGRMFIDASYEADLMARSDVSYTIGRESHETYREEYAGFRVDNPLHQFDIQISGVDAFGNPLPGITGEIFSRKGEGDRKVGAYNFRPCLTNDPENIVPIKKPQNYNPKTFELLARYLERKRHPKVRYTLRLDPLPNKKHCLNAAGPLSTDLIGQNWDYPDGNLHTRKRIWKHHKDHALGVLYFLTHNPRVPAYIRTMLTPFGLCKDEFVETGNWPPELYLREGRRMLGEFVMTEHDVRTNVKKQNSIGIGSYRIEAHHVQRLLRADGQPVNEGYLTKKATPYEIPYKAVTPKKEEASNLLVPVALSASHVAYSTLRMEPVYMILGQSAGTAAALAVELGRAVQELPIEKLHARLAKGEQIITVQ